MTRKELSRIPEEARIFLGGLFHCLLKDVVRKNYKASWTTRLIFDLKVFHVDKKTQRGHSLICVVREKMALSEKSISKMMAKHPPVFQALQPAMMQGGTRHIANHYCRRTSGSTLFWSCCTEWTILHRCAHRPLFGWRL